MKKATAPTLTYDSNYRAVVWGGSPIPMELAAGKYHSVNGAGNDMLCRQQPKWVLYHTERVRKSEVSQNNCLDNVKPGTQSYNSRVSMVFFV
jgi:hypothetical protein